MLPLPPELPLPLPLNTTPIPIPTCARTGFIQRDGHPLRDCYAFNATAAALADAVPGPLGDPTPPPSAAEGAAAAAPAAAAQEMASNASSNSSSSTGGGVDPREAAVVHALWEAGVQAWMNVRLVAGGGEPTVDEGEGSGACAATCVRGGGRKGDGECVCVCEGVCGGGRERARLHDRGGGVGMMRGIIWGRAHAVQHTRVVESSAHPQPVP